jgi:hypothetical protein
VLRDNLAATICGSPEDSSRVASGGTDDGLADDRSGAPGEVEVTPGEVDAPVMTLRGAGVDVNGRRVGRVVATVCLLALAVLVVVLFLAGVRKNEQITQLRQHGVAVEVTISGCLGLMGGSGSNLVGYACRGTFTLDGRRYNEAIPGNTLHPPGTTLQDLTVPGDPALLATARAVATEHPSRKVFILPTILLLSLALGVGALVLKRLHVPAASRRGRSVTAP